jgi:hypothetical protein
MVHDCLEYRETDLRHYGVSESSKSVHPSGYPMSHSTHVGFSGPVEPSAMAAWLRKRCAEVRGRLPSFAASFQASNAFGPSVLLSCAFGVSHMRRATGGSSSRLTYSLGSIPMLNSTACASAGADQCFAVRDARLFLSADTLGVGHNPKSVSSVRGIDGTSWNNKRLAGVARGLQRRKQIVEFQIDDSSNVLANDPSGSEFFNNAQHLRPEVAVICRASALPGVREGLTGEAPGNDVNAPDSALSKRLCCELLDIIEDGNVRPMFSQNLLAERFNLAKSNRLYASPLRRKVDAPDTREQAEHLERHITPSRRGVAVDWSEGWRYRLSWCRLWGGVGQ